MTLQLFNTLTGRKEEFRPISPTTVGMYTCGPTVYNYAHIGNLRAYVFADILRRTLEYNGYKVKHIMNITDIGHLTSDADEGDDKMVKALKREGKPMTLAGLKDVADKYTEAFVDDLDALNIERPSEMPRASEHIKEDVELIQILDAKGIAYRTSDGIYFDTSRFPEYGTRGGFKLGDLKEGVRVSVNQEKRNPRDFSLWKFAHSGLPAFPSPFGPGFPGWHIECSAMSRKCLDQPFDIHTGGIDHIPIHHQNEIAQSEAAYEVPLANYWIHNEFVNMGDGKMAKSDDNFITLQTLKDHGIHPLAYRYWLLTAHYRSPLNFTWKALEAAQNSYFKLLLLFSSNTPGSSAIIKDNAIPLAVSSDLNTASVIATVWELAKERNRKAILDADRVLGLDIENQSKKLSEEMNSVPEDIKKLALTREDARRIKDFKKSDELRARIQKEGFEVMDTDSDSIVRKKL